MVYVEFLVHPMVNSSQELYVNLHNLQDHGGLTEVVFI